MEHSIELTEQYIVLAIPKDTVEVDITAKVWHKGGIVNVKKTMDFDEVRAMFKEAEQGYFPEDAIFTLTDLGKEELARLKAEQLARLEEEDE